ALRDYFGFNQFKDEQETAKLVWHRVFYNYVFKGPILEWYIKVKWKFESKNYEYYNKLIGDRTKIMDVGCGYGYLSLFLHYKNEKREIIAVDYDEEKINIAKNVYDKNENLKFSYADITRLELESQDVIFINDVLHYLTEKDQLDFLEKCSRSLNEKGILVVRDGITDLIERHNKTKLTERLSTKFFNFNKKNNEFHFFSSNFMKLFAEKNGLDYEMQEQSVKTSNVLFILRKK
ncbi:MAG: methyltransferase domain-containing protein, partial [Bacteroidia bacterium]|nr:methyltransferase domain-containing protein [Bacteroidia bacterium]